MKKRLITALLLLAFSRQANAQSPNATFVPPTASITVVKQYDIWQLGTTESLDWPGNFSVLRNNLPVNGAIASKLAWCDGKVYALGRLRTWFQYTSQWLNTLSPTMPCLKVLLESPAGTQSPPATEIIDSQLNIWRLGYMDAARTCDLLAVCVLASDLLKYCNGTVYALERESLIWHIGEVNAGWTPIEGTPNCN